MGSCQIDFSDANAQQHPEEQGEVRVVGFHYISSALLLLPLLLHQRYNDLWHNIIQAPHSVFVLPLRLLQLCNYLPGLPNRC
jgi:hypothetical protein